MATVTWVVFKHHKKADGTYNPKIRISHNGTSSYIATTIFTDSVRFKKGSASGVVTSELLLDPLEKSVRKYRAIINENPELIANCETSKEVVLLVERRIKGKEIDFIQFSREFISRIKNEGTQSIRTTGLNSLCHYLKEATGDEKLNIKNISTSFLRKYEAWLRKDRVIIVNQRKGTILDKRAWSRPALNDTGVRAYMGTIQYLFNAALEEYNDYEMGDIFIPNNPFKVYKLPASLESKKRAIDAPLIKMVYEFTPKGCRKRTMMFTRDMYILSFLLAGMNLSDMLDCKINGGRMEYNRRKTKSRKRDGAFISIPIHPLASEIIERYKDPTGEKAFDLHKRYADIRGLTKGIHRGMRSLCEDLGIEYMTFYSARHSFATIARNDCNVSKDDIALCLTHSSGHDITDTYIKKDFSRIDDVVNKVVDFVFKEKATD